MPRPPRKIIPDQIYHVLNRGNRRTRIFRKPEDYEAFLACLSEGLRRYQVDLLAWCLMPNHWHLVLRPRGPRQLQQFMQWITLTHVRRHHAHHGQMSGHLYQGRYKHFCVEEDSYFLTLCRYVEANAMRAGLISRAEQWPWSSLSQRANRRSLPPLTDWPMPRPRDWTRLVNEPIDAPKLKQLREHVIRDRPLGTTPWICRMAARQSLEQSLHPRGRPALPLESLSPRQRRRREKLAKKSHPAGQIGT
jgi:putative transposase